MRSIRYFKISRLVDDVGILAGKSILSTSSVMAKA